MESNLVPLRGGSMYEPVDSRIERYVRERRASGTAFSLASTIIESPVPGWVVVKVRIIEHGPDGEIFADVTRHGTEPETSVSALEKAETGGIGRCLAALGFDDSQPAPANRTADGGSRGGYSAGGGDFLAPAGRAAAPRSSAPSGGASTRPASPYSSAGDYRSQVAAYWVAAGGRGDFPESAQALESMMRANGVTGDIYQTKFGEWVGWPTPKAISWAQSRLATAPAPPPPLPEDSEYRDIGDPFAE